MSLTPEREQEIREVHRYRAVNGLSDLMEGLFEGDVFTELLAEIDRLRAERTWQPMENAPKDGTTVLLVELHQKRIGPLQHGPDHDVPPFVTMGSFSPKRDEWDRYGVGRINPALLLGWLPLPAPPTTEEK